MSPTDERSNAPWEEEIRPATSSNDSDDAADDVDAVSGSDVFPDESETVPPEKAPLINEIAMEFIGFWNRLVSQTNWEKGKVIQTWRTRLIDAGLPRSVYSDESIAQRIGNVSSQHVGRLRRVFERFGDAETYRENDRFVNLFWSHYQAALDWEDADQWLDKASVDGLSVAQMRIARWEKYGAPADRKPKESEIVPAEPDEDVNPMNDSEAEFIDILPPGESEGKGTKGKKSSDGDSEENDGRSTDGGKTRDPDSFRGSDEPWESPTKSTGEILRDMGDYPTLPDDLAGPVDALKEAILNHKLAGWESASQDDLLKWLAALRGIVLSEE